MTHIRTDDELILADGIAVADWDDCCYVTGCTNEPAVTLGDDHMLLCDDHAAVMVRQSLQIIEVQEALAKLQEAVLPLGSMMDLINLNRMLQDVVPSGPEQARMRERLLNWSGDQIAMQVAGPPVKREGAA